MRLLIGLLWHNLNAVFATNNLLQHMQYANIIRPLVQAIKTAEHIYETFRDGFQALPDGIALWQEVPNITVVVRETPAAYRELKALPSRNYDDAILELADALDLSSDVAEARVKRVVRWIAKLAHEIEGDVDVIKEGIQIFSTPEAV